VSQKSNELFYRSSGKQQDKELHEEILAGDHREATEIGKQVARRIGLSEAEIGKLYSEERQGGPRTSNLAAKLIGIVRFLRTVLRRRPQGKV
jgi:hypothetical protein